MITLDYCFIFALGLVVGYCVDSPVTMVTKVGSRKGGNYAYCSQLSTVTTVVYWCLNYGLSPNGLPFWSYFARFPKENPSQMLFGCN